MRVYVCVCVLTKLTYLAPMACQHLDLQEFYRTAAAFGSPELTAQTEDPHPMFHPKGLHPKKLRESQIASKICQYSW